MEPKRAPHEEGKQIRIDARAHALLKLAAALHDGEDMRTTADAILLPALEARVGNLLPKEA